MQQNNNNYIIQRTEPTGNTIIFTGDFVSAFKILQSLTKNNNTDNETLNIYRSTQGTWQLKLPHKPVCFTLISEKQHRELSNLAEPVI